MPYIKTLPYNPPADAIIIPPECANPTDVAPLRAVHLPAQILSRFRHCACHIRRARNQNHCRITCTVDVTALDAAIRQANRMEESLQEIANMDPLSTWTAKSAVYLAQQTIS